MFTTYRRSSGTPIFTFVTIKLRRIYSFTPYRLVFIIIIKSGRTSVDAIIYVLSSAFARVALLPSSSSGERD